MYKIRQQAAEVVRVPQIFKFFRVGNDFGSYCKQWELRRGTFYRKQEVERDVADCRFALTGYILHNYVCTPVCDPCENSQNHSD